MGSAGVGVTPGPSHWKSGVPVSSVGRVIEQVRVTLSPAMTEEEGEEVREMMIGSVEINRVRFDPRVLPMVIADLCSSHNLKM